MIDFNNKGFFKLKQNADYAEKVSEFLLEDEHIVDSYKSMRDGVVFTSKRLIAVNVQVITGRKKDFTTFRFYKAGIFNKNYLVSKKGRYKGYPHRSFSNGGFTDGFSDHFPVYVYLIKEIK